MLYFFHKFTKCGPLAQLGERYTGSVEVVGSIPIGSTIIFYHSQDSSRFLSLVIAKCRGERSDHSAAYTLL